MTKSISRSQVRLIAIDERDIRRRGGACAMLRIGRDVMYWLAEDPDDPFTI